MRKKIKSFFQVIALLMFVTALQFGRHYFEDKCSPEYISEYTQKMMNPKTNTKRKKFQKIKQEVLAAGVAPEKVETYLITTLKYTNAVKHDCPISKELENEFLLLGAPEDPNAKQCQEGMFLENAKADYLKESKKDTYPIFEDAFLEEIKEQRSQRTKEILEEKWKEPEFRKATIIASIQMMYREKHNCKNAGAPLFHHIRPIVKEIAQ